MAILRRLWNVLRGVGLLLVLVGVVTTVLITSCVASLFAGPQPDRPGRVRVES